jgi:hypothetical protein
MTLCVETGKWTISLPINSTQAGSPIPISQMLRRQFHSPPRKLLNTCDIKAEEDSPVAVSQILRALLIR